MLPLHIFEERYRTMLRRCLDASTPFGVVLIREGRESGRADLSLAGVGTMATIREVSRNADGTFDILTVGTRRFRLVSVDATREPYLIGEVEELDEEEGDADRARLLAEDVSDRFIRYVELVGQVDARRAGVAPAVGDDDEDEARADADEVDDEDEDDEEGAGAAELTIPDDPTTLSHLLGGILSVEPVKRQELLEAPTSAARLALLADLLDREILLLGRDLETYVPDPRLSRASRN